MKGLKIRTIAFQIMIMFGILTIGINNRSIPTVDKTIAPPNKLESSTIFNWDKFFNQNKSDEGRAIAIDSDDNIYMTGKVFNTTKNSFDVILIKCNNDGIQEWNITWGGNANDTSRGMVINGSKDIYVVGSTESYGNGSSDVFLLKYNASGSLIWNITWGGIEWDEGYDIEIDNSNKIYIACYSESIDINGDNHGKIK